MNTRIYDLRRLSLSLPLETALKLFAWTYQLLPGTGRKPSGKILSGELDPSHPINLETPYPYYRRLRDEYPVYQPEGQDFYCISRYQDIQDIARQTEMYSSNIVSVLLDKLRGAGKQGHTLKHPGRGSLKNLGVSPVDVLAIQDPPAHKYQKLLTHQILSAPFVRALEEQVTALSQQLIDEFLPGDATHGETEFMNAIAWRLPMLMAMRLLGFPEEDYPKVKQGCAQTIRLVSGLSNPGEFANQAADGLALFRYCWTQFRRLQADPPDNLAGGLVRAANDPDHPLTDEEAVSIILQILIAGSDSSASSMGNALRLLINDPALCQRLRDQPKRTNDFIEEVFRLESAFQGHFRVLREDTNLHGVPMRAGSRVFLLWASGNRDERYWEDPDSLNIDRPNLRRHLTFGHGLHACLGRELARMEIRILLQELLARTRDLQCTGPTPHVASLFTRTLVQLPLAAVAA